MRSEIFLKSEQIRIQLKKYNNNCNIHAKQATIYKGGKKIRNYNKGKKNESYVKKGRMILRG